MINIFNNNKKALISLRAYIESVYTKLYKVESDDDLTSELVLKVFEKTKSYDSSKSNINTFIYNIVKFNFVKIYLNLNVHTSAKFGNSYHSGNFRDIPIPINFTSLINSNETSIEDSLESDDTSDNNMSLQDIYGFDKTDFEKLSNRSKIYYNQIKDGSKTLRKKIDKKFLADSRACLIPPVFQD